MIKGLYTAASGMMVQMSRQDAIANNLANTDTSGYKKQTAVSQAFPDMLMSRLNDLSPAKPDKASAKIGKIGTGASIAEITTDFSGGLLYPTENSTDIAIQNPEGYLVVDTAQGEKYTRNGALKVNLDGLLTDSAGNPVLGMSDDYIYIGGGEFAIDRRGNIMVDGEEIDTLKIVGFANPEQMERQGDNLYSSTNAAAEEYVDNPEIIQGYIEKSNVNAIKEMVELVTVVRSYEAMQKLVQSEDEAVGIAIEKVGSTN